MLEAKSRDRPESDAEMAAALLHQDGRIEVVGDRAVWVHSGCTAEMMIAGGNLIWEECKAVIGPYSARHLAAEVFAAMSLLKCGS